jgi:putative pyoverdin transport system ATP-binding/permease protein
MSLLWFLLRESWVKVTMATLVGSFSGALNVVLLSLINEGINDIPKAATLAINYFVIVILTLTMSILSQFMLINISQNAVYQLRLRLSQWILSSPLKHLEELGSQRLLATLTEDTYSIATAVSNIPLLSTNLAVVIGCLLYLYYLNWITFIGVTLFLLCSIVILNFLLIKSNYHTSLAREQGDNLFQHFRAITDGIKELKLNNQRRDAFLSEELQVTATISKNHRVTSLQILALASSASELLLFIILGLVVWGIPKFFGIGSNVLSGYVLIITYLIKPIETLLIILPVLSQAHVALRKVSSLRISLVSQLELNDSDTNILLFKKYLRLSNISHTYENKGEPNSFCLGPINLTFYPGEIAFIIGGNGSGKSTLAKIITGLYKPENGNIYLDGQYISDFNRENYRQLFSSIFSDFYLFSRLLGINHDNQKTRIQSSLDRLQLSHKVQIENGVFSTLKLSQGQRKRLALLTAYLEDRPIYLFDEWASDQDPYFRDIFYYQLLPDLKRRGKTIIAISHDDRYFHIADKLIKLDFGKVMEIPNKSQSRSRNTVIDRLFFTEK